MVLGGVVIGIGWYVFDWWALRGQNQNPSSNAASGIAPSAPCIASVLVDDIPIGAELLVRAGLSPGDLEQLVPGTRAEFVATADEFVPKRVVVPPGTRWESGPDGRPRFELAIQLEPKASVLSADAWPWPDIAVPADAIRGELRVVTMPPGAEVWSPRGTGPTISVEGLRCGSPVELLVVGWKSGKLSRQRLRVNANQLTPERGQRAVVAHVTGRL